MERYREVVYFETIQQLSIPEKKERLTEFQNIGKFYFCQFKSNLSKTRVKPKTA
jgi:hypothetical protein